MRYLASKSGVTLKTGLARVRSRSLEMAPFDRSRTSSYSPSIVTIWRYLVSFASYGDLLVENGDFFKYYKL